jgi:hypothetical protein
MDQEMTDNNEKVFSNLENAINDLREAISTGDRHLVATDIGGILVAVKALIDSKEIDENVIFEAADKKLGVVTTKAAKKTKKKQETK